MPQTDSLTEEQALRLRYDEPLDPNPSIFFEDETGYIWPESCPLDDSQLEAFALAGPFHYSLVEVAA